MATLKISDLSVGDWVRDGNGIIAKVRGIENWSNGYILNVQTVSGSICSLSATGALPIPITAEILEKNGFTRRSSEFPIYGYTTLLGKMLRTTTVSLNHPYSYIACRIEDTSKELHEPDRITVGSSVDRNPIHIHDLQHALRLAGVDIEINL